jgi:hypothetical protein
MKFRIALVAVLAVGLAASLAVAAPAKGPKGKTGTTTTTVKKVKKVKKVCRPNVSLILKGKLVAVADDQLSFTMDVKQTNRHAKAYKGKTVAVQVNAKTKIRLHGKRVMLSALTGSDVVYRLDVQARVCKKSTGEPAPPLAVRVVAKPVKPAPTTTTAT